MKQAVMFCLKYRDKQVLTQNSTMDYRHTLYEDYEYHLSIIINII